MVAFSSVSSWALAFTFSATLTLSSPITSGDENPQLLLSSSLHDAHTIHPTILSALDQYPDDPLAALLLVKPGLADMMAEPRLLWLFDQEETRSGVWMTEGDKLRLRREGRRFMDLTEDQAVLGESFVAGKARTYPCPFETAIQLIVDSCQTCLT